MNNRQNLSLIAVIFSVTLLSSCFVAKKYERPEVNTQNLYRSDQLTDSIVLAQDSSSLAQISWKNLFSDALLQQYIQQALDNNLDIRIAVENINAAEAYLKQGKASYWPSVNASLDYSHSKNSQNGQAGALFKGPIDQFQLAAGLSWEADIWGKIRSQERSLNATYLQTIEAHKAVKTRLVSSVASTYYQLAALSEQIQIAEQNIASRDSSLQTIISLKSAGMTTEVAVKQTETSLYDAKVVLLNLKQSERILENTFCFLLNEPPHSITRNSLNAQNVQTNLSTGVPAKLLANRPDVKQAEYSFMNAFELTNVAKSNFYPTLSITANGGFQSIDIKDWLSANSIFSNIAAGILQPVFNRRQIRTNYEVAQSRQEQARLMYEQVVLNAGNEVSNALYEYQTQNEAIELLQKQYEASSLAVQYSEQLLVNGMANYLEVLTARQNALAVQLNLVNIRYAQLNSIISLYSALGGGWQ